MHWSVSLLERTRERWSSRSLEVEDLCPLLYLSPRFLSKSAFVYTTTYNSQAKNEVHLICREEEWLESWRCRVALVSLEASNELSLLGHGPFRRKKLARQQTVDKGREKRAIQLGVLFSFSLSFLLLSPLVLNVKISTMAPTGKYQGQQQGPMVENLETSSTVSQRLIILEGRAGGSHPPPFSHLLAHPDSSSGFSPVKWEVNHGFFKALVSLTPGNNDIKLDWLQTESSSPISTHFNLNFQPSNAPPLHLAILVASDSPSLRNNGRVDLSQQQPSKQQSHGSMFKRVLTPLKSNFGSSDSGDRPIVDCPNNWRKQVLSEGGLDEVKRRFAIQAYLWQVSL